MTGRRVRDLLRGEGPLVCGIINVTPDSFSDGGLCADVESALRHAARLVEDGAAMLDVGGESTRPGSSTPPVEEEKARVVPVIATLRRELSVAISVDTSEPAVMTAAVEAGASMINDVRALRRAGALRAAASLDVPVCLMHMKGEPATMQNDPRYDDVVAEVCADLAARRAACIQSGISSADIVLDPGFGFGKRLADNVDLLRQLADVVGLGSPVMVGISRKSMIGELTGQAVTDRAAGSVAAAMIAAQRGARILRVHDVRQTVDALSVLGAVDARVRTGRSSAASPRPA